MEFGLSIENSGDDATDYFYVLPHTEEVLLSTPLTMTEQSEFRVRQPLD